MLFSSVLRPVNPLKMPHALQFSISAALNPTGRYIPSASSTLPKQPAHHHNHIPQTGWNHRQITSSSQSFISSPSISLLPSYHGRNPLRQTRRHNVHEASPYPQRRATPTSSETRPRSETRCRETVKRKVALVVAYEGSGYHGFQRNEGVSTLSDVLEQGLHAANAISDDNVGSLEKIKWQVAARTDRGVSAAGNLISAKLQFNRDELADGSAYDLTSARTNANLPSHVRLIAIKYITGSFSARACCEARWYEYLMPLSVLGGDPAILHSLNSIMRQYEGSNLFHNFTIGLDHCSPPRGQARRFITQATCDLEPISLPIVADSNHDTQWVRIQVKGQSFMLHQIRKMVSLAILTVLKRVPEDAVSRALQPLTLINVPPAPALGLFLDCCRFGWYNERQKKALPEPLNMNEFESARHDFKLAEILPSIARRFSEEDALEIYFNTVDMHPVQFD